MQEYDSDPDVVVQVMNRTAFLETWVDRNPAAAAEAMLGFPEDLGPAQVSNVILQWAGDPTVPRIRFHQRPSRARARPRRVRCRSLVERIRYEDPEAAAQWADTIVGGGAEVGDDGETIRQRAMRSST